MIPIVFDARAESLMPRLLEVETGCGVLDQGAANVVLAVEGCAKNFQHDGKLVMEFSFESVIADFLEERRCFGQDV